MPSSQGERRGCEAKAIRRGEHCSPAWSEQISISNAEKTAGILSPSCLFSSAVYFRPVAGGRAMLAPTTRFFCRPRYSNGTGKPVPYRVQAKKFALNQHNCRRTGKPSVSLAAASSPYTGKPRGGNLPVLPEIPTPGDQRYTYRQVRQSASKKSAKPAGSRIWSCMWLQPSKTG